MKLLRRSMLFCLLLLFPLGSCRLDARQFVRGNANGDTGVDISDAVYMLLYLFGDEDTMKPCIDKWGREVR